MPRRWHWPRCLKADACEIYTDVTGVFTADPRVVPTPADLPGSPSRRCSRSPPPAAGCSMLRSVEFARNHHVPAARPLQLHLGARDLGRRGGCRPWKQAVVTAVTHDTSRGQGHRSSGVPDRPGVAAQPVPGPGRPVDQRRHDRAEHLGPRDDRHLVHRAQDRTWPTAVETCPGHGGRARASGGSPPTTTSPGSRSSGPA